MNNVNKTVDFALVGHNYVAFLLSIGLLARGKKVLVLDDDRFNYGDFFTNSLTQLDVEFLKKWGEEANLVPLKELESYLRPEKVYFFVGKKQVVLGDQPLRNYRELCRKFSKLFLSEEKRENGFGITYENEMIQFNNNFNDFCQKVSTYFFVNKKYTRIYELFFNSLSHDLAERFHYFFSHFNNKDLLDEDTRSEFNSLTYMTRGFFQNRLSTSGSKSELMHLFFSLISPYYKLDHERLIADLLKEHLEKGGEFKKLNLSDLKAQSGIVKSFELESFDGIIRPHKMAFIGGYPVDLPIKLKTPGSLSYNCLNVEMIFEKPIPNLLNGKKCVFTSPIKIGTDRPFWEAFFKDNTAVFNIIMSRKEGTKIDFISERVKNLLLEDLQYLYPEYKFELLSYKMKFTLDVFIEDKNYEAHKKIEGGLKRKIVDVLEDTAPMLMSRLKNVLYFGPYNEDSLGTFSSLVEIKQWKETL